MGLCNSRGTSLPEAPGGFDMVVMNPPYRKVNTNTNERRLLQRIG